MLLTARDIHKAFGKVTVLRGVDLDLGEGQSLALMGESGSGKSTLIHILGALDVPDQGVITFQGQDIAPMNDAARAAIRRDHIGIVFQQFNLIPSLSAGENLKSQRLNVLFEHESHRC